MWKVVEVSSASGEKVIGKEEIILKDVWMNKGSPTEVENLDAVFEAVEEFVDTGIDALLEEYPNATREFLLSSPRAMREIIERDSRFKSFDDVSKERLSSNLASETYRSLFLTTLHAWRGATNKPLTKSAWPFPSLFSASSIKDLDDDLYYPKELNEQERELISRRFVPKHQARFIYKEACSNLHGLNTVGEVVDILCQAMDGKQMFDIFFPLLANIMIQRCIFYFSLGGYTATFPPIISWHIVPLPTSPGASRSPDSSSPV